MIFFFSFGAIYGEQETYPTPETHPARPTSPYGVAKLAVEYYLHYYQVVHEVQSVVLRYANVYGPRQDPYGEAGVVAIFIDLLLKGERPVIFGDGHQTRDFVFVGDVARANLLALNYLEDHPKNSTALAMNIGTGQELSVNTLFEYLTRFHANAPEPIYAPPKPGEQRRSVIDPSYAKRAMGWEALVSLEEGLKKTWDWFKERSG